MTASGGAADLVQPLPGDGLVAREGELSLVCARPATAALASVVDGLLGALVDAAAAGEDGLALVRRAIGVLTASVGPDPLSFALAGPDRDGGTAMLAGGAGRARAVTASGADVTVGGDAAYTWTDRTVREPVVRLELTLPGVGSGDPDSWLRLSSGVVSGGGLRQLSPPRARPVSLAHPDRPPVKPAVRPAVAAAAEPVAKPGETPRLPAPGDVPLVTRLDGMRRPPTPVHSPHPEPAAARPSGPQVPHVLGVNCKNHHFNDPRAMYCAVCGISMMQATLSPFRAPRPPLGVLLMDDGQTVPLATDVLIGREPRTAPEVTGKTAIPLRLSDEDGSISRRHTLVHLDEWQVALVDLGSVNGTAVMPPGARDFDRLMPDTPVPLTAGTVVRIGVSRTFRFESNREA
ncbi:FHA domain-containing protein [Actinomadura miaoliensis]|uniref:FHA domain-containing protein n=1 Tax=Actinomadura miaoliensis TaxID=430685 RepID=A0ABP7W5J9_9ACTN